MYIHKHILCYTIIYYRRRSNPGDQYRDLLTKQTTTAARVAVCMGPQHCKRDS